MYSLLLVIIYIAFISLGLPDSLIGSAWPVMHLELQTPVSSLGILTMLISGGTILSSLLADRLTRRFGTGLVTAVSVFLTAAALFGFSVSGSFWLLCLWAIPYGLGAGAVDASLNNYVALHYASRHMSWLHCFWGVGCSVSPYIMSFALTGYSSWSLGFRIVSVLQILLTLCLFLSLPLWKKAAAASDTGLSETCASDTGISEISGPNDSPSGKALPLRKVLRLKGVPLVLITFISYCALESTAGMWASSYLVQYRGIGAETAARFASLFYLGITFGRFLCGFVADRLGDKTLIRIGSLTALAGILLVLLPLPFELPALAGLVIIGLGCAPIYPSIIHSTPEHFGRENSQAVIGVQMASAYAGSTFMPPLFGLLAAHVSIGLYPLYLLLFDVLMLAMSERLRRSL
ncbi:MAG: MFS transporter [Roseburia sp.]|nr:MFS transporter [Roseburia sp.]MCM1096785.1 MFS transporter [Ruminococcus flavefaciens]